MKGGAVAATAASLVSRGDNDSSWFSRHIKVAEARRYARERFRPAFTSVYVHAFYLLRAFMDIRIK